MNGIRKCGITYLCALSVGIVSSITSQVSARITDNQWTGIGQAQSIYYSSRWGAEDASGFWIDGDGTATNGPLWEPVSMTGLTTS